MRSPVHAAEQPEGAHANSLSRASVRLHRLHAPLHHAAIFDGNEDRFSLPMGRKGLHTAGFGKFIWRNLQSYWVLPNNLIWSVFHGTYFYHAINFSFALIFRLI